MTEIGVVKGRFFDRGDPSAYDFTLGSFSADVNWHDLDLSTIVPSGAIAVLIRATGYSPVSGQDFNLRKKGNSNTINKSTLWALVTGINFGQDLIVSLDTNRFVQYNVPYPAWGAINLSVAGWWI